MTSGAAKILVTDDTLSERALARQVLEEVGYEVCEAADGLHALEVFAAQSPDLVMLDVVMPKMTGIEACRILKARAQGRYLPVLMVSTKNTVNARVEGLRSGADDYLGKPYDPQELLARVEVLLRTRARVEGGVPDFDAAGARHDTSSSTAEATSTEEQGREFRARLDQEFLRAERYSDPLACLKVQVDPPAAGTDPASAWSDSVVNQVHDAVEQHIRKVDIAFRLDRGTFAAILPNTHFPGALAAAERISIAVQRLRTPDGDGVTVSIGVSFFPNKDTKSASDLGGLVDVALQRARNAGPGRICLYQHQGYLYVPEAG